MGSSDFVEGYGVDVSERVGIVDHASLDAIVDALGNDTDIIDYE